MWDYLCGRFSVQTLWEIWLAIGFQYLFSRKFRFRKCQRDISKLSITISIKNNLAMGDLVVSTIVFWRVFRINCKIVWQTVFQAVCKQLVEKNPFFCKNSSCSRMNTTRLSGAVFVSKINLFFSTKVSPKLRFFISTNKQRATLGTLKLFCLFFLRSRLVAHNFFGE